VSIYITQAIVHLLFILMNWLD